MRPIATRSGSPRPPWCARPLSGCSPEGVSWALPEWDARGIPTVTGARWSAQVMRRMLVSARVSGRRERRTIDGHRREIGSIVATAVWPAIISAEQSDRLRRLLGNGERRMNGSATKYLLTGGMAVCGLCGAALVARPRAVAPSAAHPEHRPSAPSLVCASGPGFKGCGDDASPPNRSTHWSARRCSKRSTGEFLLEVMARTDDNEAVEGLLVVEGKLAELAADWASDRISRGEWDAARAACSAASNRSAGAWRRHVAGMTWTGYLTRSAPPGRRCHCTVVAPLSAPWSRPSWSLPASAVAAASTPSA